MDIWTSRDIKECLGRGPKLSKSTGIDALDRYGLVGVPLYSGEKVLGLITVQQTAHW